MEESDDDDVSMGDVSMAGSDDEVDAPLPAEEPIPYTQEALHEGRCIDENIAVAVESSNGSGEEPDEEPQAVRTAEQPHAARNCQLEQQSPLSEDETRLDERESAITTNEQLAPQVVESQAGEIAAHVDSIPSLEQNIYSSAQDASLVERESAITAREQTAREQSKANQEMLKELEDLETQLAARAKTLEEWEAELVSREASLKQVVPHEMPAPQRASNSEDDFPRSRLDIGFVDIPPPVTSFRAGERLTRGEQTRASASTGPRQVETRSSRCLPDTSLPAALSPFLPDGKKPKWWFNEGDTVQIIAKGPYRGMRASIRRFLGGKRLECGVESSGDCVLLRRDEVQLLESCNAPMRQHDDIVRAVSTIQRQQEKTTQRQSTVKPPVQARATAFQSTSQTCAQTSRGVKRLVDGDTECANMQSQIIAKSSEEAKSEAASVSSAAQSILNNQKRLNNSVQSGSGSSMLRSALWKSSKHATPDNITIAGTFSQLGNALDALLPGRKVDLNMYDRPSGVEARAEDLLAKPKKQRTRAVKSDKAKRLLKDIDAQILRKGDP